MNTQIGLNPTTQRSSFHRARTEKERQARHEKILASAENLVRGVGFDKFTMASLARDSGLSKGTIYLYFEKKEDIFYHLFNRLISNWIDKLRQQMSPKMNDRDFCRLIFEITNEDPLPIEIGSRLRGQIEINASSDIQFESKVENRKTWRKLGKLIERSLNLPEGMGFQLLWSLMTVLMGAYVLRIDDLAFKDGISETDRAFIEPLRFENVYFPTALVIMQGIRAKAESHMR